MYCNGCEDQAAPYGMSLRRNPPCHFAKMTEVKMMTVRMNMVGGQRYG